MSAIWPDGMVTETTGSATRQRLRWTETVVSVAGEEVGVVRKDAAGVKGPAGAKGSAGGKGPPGGADGTTIRPLGRPGDLGWVVMAHGEVYAAEYGFNGEFEALVAKIVADSAAGPDPRRQHAGMADADGQPGW